MRTPQARASALLFTTGLVSTLTSRGTAATLTAAEAFEIGVADEEARSVSG